MKKKIGLGILIALLAGSFYGYTQWTKPHREVAAAAEDLNIAATDLFKAFSTNEATANPKYLDKLIKVCGTVADNSVTDNGVTTVQLATGDEMGIVMCELDKLTKQEKTSFAKGQTVCFKGLCSGYLTDVVLNRCVLTH